MRYYRSRRQRNAEFWAQAWGIFLLAGAALWLVAVTYGTILVPVAVGLWLYRRKTGRWPGRRR
jgi:hypothetical protein